MEKKKELQKKEIAKEALKAISELEQSVQIETVIKDNKIEFKVGKDMFRVRKPNLAEQQEIGDIRRKKYLEFVDDDSYLFKKQWIEKYKKKGIDIDKMETDIVRMQNEIKKLLLRLAEVSDKKSIEQLKKEIFELRDKQYEISIEKTDLLSHSIEDQLTIYANSYSTYLVLEKKDGDKWIKYFKSYEDFEKSDEGELISKSFYYINLLIYGVE